MKRLLISLTAVLLLIGIVALPVQAAQEQSLGASVTVSEVVSITLTDAGTAGINFGTLSAGVTGQGDTDQSNGTPAVKVNVGSETNVSVDIGIKGSTAGALGLSNWKYSTTFAGTKTSLTGSYLAVYTSKAASSASDFYHWIDVPGGTTAGIYTCTVYYKAVKTGTGF